MRRQSELPIVGCCCPVCGDLGLQRQRIKRMLLEVEREHPGVKASLLKALGNVMPRHLLDRRLNPPADAADAARLGASTLTTNPEEPAGVALEPVSVAPRADPGAGRRIPLVALPMPARAAGPAE